MKYAPEDITSDVIEAACDDLRCALDNVLDNRQEDDEWLDEFYNNAVLEIKRISALLDAMMPEGE